MNEYNEPDVQQKKPTQLLPPHPQTPQTMVGQIMLIQSMLNETADPVKKANLKNEMTLLLMKSLKAIDLPSDDVQILEKSIKDYTKAGLPIVTQQHIASGKAPFKYLVKGDFGEGGELVAELASPSEIEGLNVARDAAAQIFMRKLEPILINITAMAIRNGLLKIEGGIDNLPLAELFKREIEEGEDGE